MKNGLSAAIGLAVLASTGEALTYYDGLVTFKDQDNCLKNVKNGRCEYIEDKGPLLKNNTTIQGVKVDRRGIYCKDPDAELETWFRCGDWTYFK